MTMHGADSQTNKAFHLLDFSIKIQEKHVDTNNRK